MASNFQEKYRSFMARRNGPDDLGRDLFVLGVVLLVLGALLNGGMVGALFLLLGLAAIVYAYFQMFSTKIDQRRAANRAYVAKRNEVLGKLKAPFAKAGTGKAAGKAQEYAQRAQRAAEQAKAAAADKDHRYFACPKCKQAVRVPKGAGKIRVTCPKCGEKFQKKA
jgi:ribosomal protein L37AE/L43A